MTENFWEKANECFPEIYISEILKNETAILNQGDTYVVDLGNHYVGYFSFKMWYTSQYIDAPVKFSIRFCETFRELDDDYSEGQSTLCRSWLQEDIITVDFPGIYKMPRRYAARYIKISVLNTPKPVLLSEFTFKAQTSANMKDLKPLYTDDKELANIDKTSVNTLKSCMQRVFEDGPKRDRRLWIGDLRLEALANYYTFGNTKLVERCLYLFATTDKNSYGLLPGYVYENPHFVSGDWFLADYSLLYICTLCDYHTHTGNRAVFNELYPVAKAVLDGVDNAKDENGIVTVCGGEAFIDWCAGLEKATALHGVYRYTLDLWCNALKSLDHPELTIYEKRLKQGREHALNVLYNESENAFINSYDSYQYSVQATVWMILGGVLTDKKAHDTLISSLNSESSVKPFTPYMHHYVTEALIKAGDLNLAENYIRSIWGGMLCIGSDTFPEVYVQNDPDFSPYGDRKINSMCHAWSCTPTYFIRKYKMGSFN